MTNSFLSENSFQPQASPVDTYIRPSQVAPTTGFDQLVNALVTVSPGLNAYFESKVKQEIKNEQTKGTKIAIEQATDGFKNITQSIRKKDGDAAARQLIGGSIFAQNAYQKTKAQILGNTVKSKLTNSYATTSINNQPLTAYTFESPEFQGWLKQQRTTVIDQLGDVNATYVNEHFLPELAEATGSITSHHIKQHKEYKFEELKSLTTPLVNQVIASDETSAGTLIQGWELSLKQLGIQGTDLQAVNKMIVESLADQAEAIALTEGGTLEDATDILDKAKLFKYGPGGALDLSQHPDFIDESTRIKKAINDFEWKNSQREIAIEKRKKGKDVDTVLKGYGKLLEAAENTQDPTEKKKLLEQAANSLENLTTTYPDLAPKINNIVTNLDGDTQDRYAELLGRIKTSGFDSKADAQFAALQWLQDERTPDTPQNTKLYDNLIRAIDDVEDGQYVYASKLLTELKGQIKGELSNSPEAIYIDSGLLKGPAASEKNRLFNEAADDFYDWIDKFKEDKGKAPSKTEQREYFTDTLRKKTLDAAKKWKPKTVLESGVEGSKDPNKDLQGSANDAKDPNKDLQGSAVTESSKPVVKTDNQEQKQTRSGLDFLIGNYYRPQIINVSTLENMLESGFVTSDKGGRFIDKAGNYYQLEKGSVMPSMMTDTDDSEYEVEQGDTLTNLAEQFSTTVKEIMDANNLTDADFLQIGQKLMIPINTIGDALVPESDLQNPSVLDEIDITKPFKYNSLYRLAEEVGFTSEQATIMAAIALAESGGDAQIDTVKSGLDPQKKNEFSLGLWQINMIKEYAPERLLDFKIESEQELYNPAVNARAAKIMFDQQGFEAWGAYTDGSYKKFLPKTN
tara:strand:+ start:5787 stop:8351 length:2565 start_codon:yes stop_codon:yes gene_type:complete